MSDAAHDDTAANDAAGTSTGGTGGPAAGSGAPGGASSWMAALMSPAVAAKAAKSMSDAAAQSMAHLADMSKRMLGGAYQPKDLAADLAQCNQRLVGLVRTVMGHMAAGTSDPAPTGSEDPGSVVLRTGAEAPVGGSYDTGATLRPAKQGMGPHRGEASAPKDWGTTMRITAADRPLTLQTAGFRKIGGGPAIVIGPDVVKIEPSTIPDGTVTSFSVTVRMKDIGPGVYTGVITSVEHPDVAVTDPIMPSW